MECAGGLDVFSYFGAVFLKGRRVGDVVPRVDAGYRKARLCHLAVRGVRHRGVEDARLFRELRLVYVVYLYSGKAAVLRDLEPPSFATSQKSCHV